MAKKVSAIIKYCQYGPKVLTWQKCQNAKNAILPNCKKMPKQPKKKAKNSRKQSKKGQLRPKQQKISKSPKQSENAKKAKYQPKLCCGKKCKKWPKTYLNCQKLIITRKNVFTTIFPFNGLAKMPGNAAMQ